MRKHASQRISMHPRSVVLISAPIRAITVKRAYGSGPTAKYGLRELPLCTACAAALTGKVYQRPGAERARAIASTAA